MLVGTHISGMMAGVYCCCNYTRIRVLGWGCKARQSSLCTTHGRPTAHHSPVAIVEGQPPCFGWTHSWRLLSLRAIKTLLLHVTVLGFIIMRIPCPACTSARPYVLPPFAHIWWGHAVHSYRTCDSWSCLWSMETGSGIGKFPFG